MLDLSKSWLLQHWELIVLFASVVYFVSRLRETRQPSAAKQKLNDDETIANDYRDDEAESDDLTPALEDVGHIRFRGALKVLKGGIQEFLDMASDRRSVRMFSSRAVDIKIVEKCIQAAGTAPSGAHTEPWTFCLVKR